MWHIADSSCIADTAYMRVERVGYRNRMTYKEISLEKLCCYTLVNSPKMRGFTSVTFSLWREHALASLRALNCSLRLDNTKVCCLDPHERKLKRPADKG